MPPTSTIHSPPLTEPLPKARQRGLNISLFHKRCVDFHWHYHRELELIYIQRGRGIRYVGQSLEPFADGDLCLLGPNLPHAFGSSPADRNGAEWIVAHFLPDRWGASFWDLPEARRIRNLLDQSQRGISFNPKESLGCLQLFRSLGETPPGGLRLARWMELLDRLSLLRRHRFLNPEASSSSDIPDRRLPKILAWIDDHAQEGISQAQAARELGMSPQAFSRYFRQKTGRPYNRYLNELRVAFSCCELLHSKAQISEIAYRSGFGNLSNFNRRFHEITGQTPRQYRATLGGMGS